MCKETEPPSGKRDVIQEEVISLGWLFPRRQEVKVPGQLPNRLSEKGSLLPLGYMRWIQPHTSLSIKCYWNTAMSFAYDLWLLSELQAAQLSSSDTDHTIHKA